AAYAGNQDSDKGNYFKYSNIHMYSVVYDYIIKQNTEMSKEVLSRGWILAKKENDIFKKDS
ncbi:hypothetical protein KAJ26_05615, partial [bacterium]|nr:hypothetical protein [bacterium]